MKDYIALDLETTGFSTDVNEIIEIGAFKVRNGVTADRFITFVKPVLYIPVSVQNLTGITMEDVSDAEPIESVLPEFFTWCEDLPFLGHNLKFDYSFLRTKGKYMKLDFTLGSTRQGICTMELSKRLLHIKKHTLQAVCDELGVDLGENAHRAGRDALSTKMVYERLCYKFGGDFAVRTPRVLDTETTVYGKAVNTSVLEFGD